MFAKSGAGDHIELKNGVFAFAAGDNLNIWIARD